VARTTPASQSALKFPGKKIVNEVTTPRRGKAMGGGTICHQGWRKSGELKRGKKLEAFRGSTVARRFGGKEKQAGSRGDALS